MANTEVVIKTNTITKVNQYHSNEGKRRIVVVLIIKAASKEWRPDLLSSQNGIKEPIVLCDFASREIAVSYTHLTLPTKRIV